MVVQSLVVLPLLAALALAVALRGLGAGERKLVAYTFAAHIVGSVALVLYHEYIFGGGDMYLYADYGRQLARYVQYDVLQNAPEALKLTFQRESQLPMSILLEGTTTASMMGLTCFVMLLVGESVYAACLGFSLFAFVGTVFMYKAVRLELAPVERRPVMLGLFLVPSVVFWSSGIVKEAVVVGALGFLLRGMSDVLARRRLDGLVWAVPGAVVMTLVKPYVAVPLAAAVGAWIYARRPRGGAIGYKIAGLVCALAGVVVVTKLFPVYGFDRVAETLAHTQQNFAYANQGAGSGFEMGDLDTDVEDQSLASSLKWAPLALANALFRPLPFDVRNIATAVAAVEMTALLWIVAALVRRHGVRRVTRAVVTRPPYLFSAIFVVAFGASVGLATANLGSLSRYRAPMMPAYVAMVLALRARLDQERAAQPARAVAVSGAARSRSVAASRAGARAARRAV